MNCVYICTYVCLSVKSAFVRTTKSTLQSCKALYIIAQNILHMHSFENGCFQPRRLKRQHVDAIGCCTFLSGPISMFVFDIVQIPSACIAPICIPPGYGLTFRLLYRRYPMNGRLGPFEPVWTLRRNNSVAPAGN